MLRHSLKYLVWAVIVPALAQGPGPASREIKYLLQPSDVIDIRYRYTPEFNETVSVQPDGFVDLQLIGECKIAGLDVKQATAVIQDRLQTRLTNPQITLILKEFQKPFFFVGGEIANPGRYELRGSMNALDGIIVSGGLKSSALHSQVLLVRRISGELAETKLIDIRSIVNTHKFAELPEIHSGDLIFVPQNRISKIERFVKWGSYGVYAQPTIR